MVDDMCGPVARSLSEGGATLKKIADDSKIGASDEIELASTARLQALQLGVVAIVDAMDGEVKFANNNETAFSLFRRGCRHCEKKTGDLDDIGPKASILAFLARIASRRGAARQLQELGAILLTSPAWRESMADAPEVLRKLLNVQKVLDSLPVVGVPAPLAHDTRVFLRERKTRRYLTVSNNCIMTEGAASLFICHCEREGACVGDVGVDAWSDADAYFAPLEPFSSASSYEKTAEFAYLGSAVGVGETVAPPPSVGFVHEGEPALGCFLSARRRPLSSLLGGSMELRLCCDSRRFGVAQEFRWGPDFSLQHASTGWWLFVDPAKPEEVVMHAEAHSAWEALPAVL